MKLAFSIVSVCLVGVVVSLFVKPEWTPVFMAAGVAAAMIILPVDVDNEQQTKDEGENGAKEQRNGSDKTGS